MEAYSDIMEINKILVADDEALIVDYLCHQLSRYGYAAFGAENGSEAYERACSDEPDLIFLDVKMPVMDGITACKKLRTNKKTKNIPIVMVSAIAHPQEIEAGLKAGANNYLTKPFSFPEILAEIEKWKTRDGV